MKLKYLCALAAASASTLASAQWYAAAAIGTTNTSISTTELAVAGATASSISRKEDDVGYKLQLGYQFNRNFALEGGYLDLGKFNATRNVTAPAVGSVRGDAKADGWNLMAVGILPMADRIALLGKIGTIYSTTKVDLSTTGAVTLAPGILPSYSKSEFNLAYGLGLQYDINKSLSVRAEWESFADLRASDAASKSTVNLYALALLVRF